MSAKINRHVANALTTLAGQPKLRRITTYVSPKITVKVTRQARTRANAKQQTFLLSVGTPNFLERRALKAGKIVKFPHAQAESFAS